MVSRPSILFIGYPRRQKDARTESNLDFFA